MKCEVCKKTRFKKLNAIEIGEKLTRKELDDSHIVDKRILCCDDCLLNMNFRNL